MNREEMIEMICSKSVDNFCNLLEEHKIKDVVPVIDQALDELIDNMEVSDEENNPYIYKPKSELNFAVPRDWNKNLPKIKLYAPWEENDD